MFTTGGRHGALLESLGAGTKGRALSSLPCSLTCGSPRFYGRCEFQGRDACMADLDVVVVGAGFAGIYAVKTLRDAGLKVRAFEAGSGIGGTWFWNCYPGARCDVESMEYSYSFSPELEQEWNWTERYARQPEILAYINHVADRFDLRKDIQFNTRVTTAHFDDATNRWTLETDDGGRFSAKYVVMATGCLSSRKTPDFKGLDSFK